MNPFSINTFRAIIATGVLAVAAAAPAMHAQDRVLARVNVPFAFEVGTTSLPAGQYDISKINEHVLLIRGASSHALVMIDREEGGRPVQRGKIVFARYGNQYFMHELWSEGSSNYEDCRETNDEKQIRGTVAALTNKRPEGVQVAISVMPSF